MSEQNSIAVGFFTTVRKFVTIVISMLYSHVSLNLMKSFGITFIFLGKFIEFDNKVFL